MAFPRLRLPATDYVNKKQLLLLVVVLIFQGCAAYQARPIDERAVSRSLAPPDLRSVRIKAGEIKHPILKPRNIDFKNGISAGDAAIIAVIANPALRAERDRSGVARAQLLQAGILPNPTFSYSLDVPTGGNSAGTVNAYGLGLDWDIKSLLTRGARIDAARAGEASVRLDIAWKEWQTAEAARMGVYRVVSLEKELHTARQEEERLKKNLDDIRKAVDTGNMTIIDLDAVDATVRKTHATVLDIEQKLEQERLGLNAIMGFPPFSRIPLKENMGFPGPEKKLPSLEDIMSGLENRRLDLLALKQGYQSQEARLRAAVRAQFPGISIGFAHSRDTSDVITTGFSVSISLPLFDRNQGRIALEKAGRKQLYDEYMNRVFQARADAAGILANIGAVEKQIDAAKKSVAALENLVSISYNGFLEGNIDALSYYNEVDRLTLRRLDVLKLKQALADLYVALEITAGEYIGGGNR
ncbi:MAG: TolC family protein [Nitrospiraceae bacterium]|nr:TolC family protein [Nitrospiraceae bacterium]